MTTCNRSWGARFADITRGGKSALVIWILIHGGIASAAVLPGDSPEQAHRKDIGKQLAKMQVCIAKVGARCETRGVHSGVECDLVDPEASTVPDPKGKVVAKLSAAIAKCEAKLDLARKGPSSGYTAAGCPGDSDSAVPGDQAYADLDDYQASVGREVREALSQLTPEIDLLCGGPDSGDLEVQSCVEQQIAGLTRYAARVLECQQRCENDYKGNRGGGGPTDDTAPCAANDASADPGFRICEDNALYQAELNGPLEPAALAAAAEIVNDMTNDLYNENDCAPGSVVPNPTVEGPVTGGRGAPWISATNFDLATVGYAQSEFFISGTASAYTNVGDLDSDGSWEAAPAGSAPYKTRIVVYRPIDPEDFNGSVVIEWLNVSGGIDAAPDWVSMHTELTREGYAWVGVSAQFVGIEGGGGLGNFSLKAVDPVRYASLSHPRDSFSYDIFSQASQAVLHPEGIDPLDGLEIERFIAVGESQSAFRMVTYVNAIHPLVRLHDGFLIHSRGGGSAALSQDPEPVISTPGVVRIRDDLREPVLTYQTETDLFTLGYLPDRQPDGPGFRLWEAAGTAHADTYTLVVGFGDKGDTPVGAELLVTSKPIPGIIECGTPINSGYQHFVLKAAIAALDAWIRGEGAPPMAPRLEVSGSPPAFVLDDFGNVRGGIRTPIVDVPIATLSGLGQTGGNFCRIFGTTVPFDAETLADLYPSHRAYVAAVGEAADSAVAAGFIRPADAILIKEAAEQSDIPG